MKKRAVALVGAMAVGLFLAAGPASAEDRERVREEVQTQEREQVYGSQLMTEEERTEYRDKMRSAHTEEEQEQIRKEHHDQMELRAKDRGVTIPDEPPAMGGGAMGSGGGMGSGRGMGSGGGRGR